MGALDRRPETCVSDLQLDRVLLAESLPEDERQRVDTHLASCEACAARLEALRADARQFPDRVFLDGLVEQTRRRAGTRWTVRLGGVAGLAAAAAALLLFVRPTPTVGIKGDGLSLEVFARHDGQVSRLVGGESLAPGDAIRFQLTSRHAGYVAVLGLDSRPSVTAYAPGEGTTLPIAADTPQTLPGSITLDATTGAERLVALRCDRPTSLSELVRAAQRALDAAGGDPQRVTKLDTPCAEATFTLHKRTGLAPSKGN